MADKPIEDPRAYLEQIRFLEVRIKSVKEQLRTACELAEKTTATITDTPSSHDSGVDADGKIINILSLQDKLQEVLNQYTSTKLSILKTIKKVDNPTFAAILELRYLTCQSWGEIENNIHYSHCHTLRMHKAALKKVKEILKMIHNDT